MGQTATLPFICRWHHCEWVWFRNGDLGFCPECFPGREEELQRQETELRSRPTSVPGEPVSKVTVWKPCQLLWLSTPPDKVALLIPRTGGHRLVVPDGRNPSRAVWVGVRGPLEQAEKVARSLGRTNLLVDGLEWWAKVTWVEGGR